MNERISALIEQATLSVPMYYGLAGLAHTKKFNKEKFAELIVQECANYAGGLMHVYPHQAALTATSIKEHFGVK